MLSAYYYCLTDYGNDGLFNNNWRLNLWANKIDATRYYISPNLTVAEEKDDSN